MAEADLLGRESVLITGLEGSGKSHYVMSQVKKILDGGFTHDIYLANITGITLTAPNVHIVDKDFNWTTAPDNSIVIYDEAGTIERFSNLKNKLYCEELQMISQRRKTGILLVFVAQDSKMINSAMRALLKFHFHFSNPYNDSKKTHCFVFPTVKSQLSNDNKGWHNDATEQFDHELDPAIFPLYKSINDTATHNKKKQVNKKARLLFLVAGGSVILCVVLAIMALKLAKSYQQKTLDPKAIQDKVNGGVSGAVSSASATVMPTSAVSGFAPGAVESQQAMNAMAKRAQEIYQDRLPKDYQILANNNDIRVNAVMLIHGRCIAYNQYSERLNVSQAYCMGQLHGGMIQQHGQNTAITESPYQADQFSKTQTVQAKVPSSAPAVTAPAVSPQAESVPAVQHSVIKK